jgi:hypothetical protein
VDPCVLYFHIPLYPHCVVLSETWRQHYLFWSVNWLCCSQHKLLCEQLEVD